MSNTLFSVPVNQLFTYGGYNFVNTSIEDSGGNFAVTYIVDSNGALTAIDTANVINGEINFNKNRLDTYIKWYKESNQQKPTKKKNPVEVIRYIRPLDEYCHGQSNMFGVTLVFTLDYNLRRIDVGISVCNGDNFDKKLGIDLAKEKGISVLNAYMPDDIYNCRSTDSLVDWFITRLPQETQPRDVVFNISRRTIELIIDIYSCSAQCKNHFNSI